MAYSTGSTIIDDDYNIFATGNAAGTGDNNTANINTVWGTGTGDKGYGQSSTISAVSAGSTITATQWATIIARMNSLANHQNTTITSITTPVAGDTISAYAALSSNITSLFNNRLNAAANGSDLTTNGTTQTTSSWDVRATTTKTVTFSSSTTLRYFFNAGGHIRMSFSRTGGTVSDKNTSWTNLLTNCGTIVVCGSATSKTIAGTTLLGTSRVGGSGATTTLATGTGAFDYTGTPVAIFKQFGTGYLYETNFVNIDASISGSTLSFAVTLEDAAADEVAPAAGTGDALDVVNGTLTMTTVIRPPSTTYISNTWGTPTQNAATWTLTS